MITSINFLERRNPPQLKYLFVDEAQDLSAHQWKVISMIQEVANQLKHMLLVMMTKQSFVGQVQTSNTLLAMAQVMKTIHYSVNTVISYS